MLKGQPVSPGVAVGRAVVFRSGEGPVPRLAVAPEDRDREVARLRRAGGQAADEFAALARESAGTVREELRAILGAHGMMASDPAFLDPVIVRIRREGVNAEWALWETAETFRRQLLAASAPTMQERADDIGAVARQIARALSGDRAIRLTDLEPGSVLVAEELTPADAARLDPSRLVAIALERGGPTSHATIMARSFGLPAVVGIAGLTNSVSAKHPVLVDGDRGVVDPRPRREQIRRCLERVRETRKRELERLRSLPRTTTTRDGERVYLRANLELAEETAAMARYAAEGVGLYRTEYLYLRSPNGAPKLEEQRAAYESILRAAAPEPVVIRTYDLGGEKGIGHPIGENPALGLRGLRYCLANTELFDTQITALLLAAPAGNLRILLPMVGSPTEVREARVRFSACAARLGIDRLPPLGTMIEVPAAALLAEALAAVSDFFSIGTNDLTQYSLAVDRSNPEVASYFRPLSPAILRMVKSVVDAGRKTGREVAVCGELASDRSGVALLLGLGIRDLSMTPVAIPAVKEWVAEFEIERLTRLADRALECADALEVDALLSGFRAAVARRAREQRTGEP
jgi:phosphoenolpyruvate-protein phosphotransferase (PTS system enzyme I)